MREVLYLYTVIVDVIAESRLLATKKLEAIEFALRGIPYTGSADIILGHDAGVLVMGFFCWEEEAVVKEQLDPERGNPCHSHVIEHL
jgi:hypothetical protein